MSHRYLRIPGMGKFVVFSFGFLTRLSIDCGFCSPTLFVSTWRNYDELIAISHRGFSPRSRRFLFGEYPHSARFGRPLRRLIILRSAIWRWRGRMGGAVGGGYLADPFSLTDDASGLISWRESDLRFAPCARSFLPFRWLTPFFLAGYSGPLPHRCNWATPRRHTMFVDISKF